MPCFAVGRNCGRSECRLCREVRVVIGVDSLGSLVGLVEWIVSFGRVTALTQPNELQLREAGGGYSGNVVLLGTLGAAGGVTQLACKSLRSCWQVSDGWSGGVATCSQLVSRCQWVCALLV